MTAGGKVPVVFTPSNEPYLGLETLHAFDKLISACLEMNMRVAEYTRSQSLNEMQKALSQIVPSSISICLSISELLRQGYVYGALVFLRPLAERIVTGIYLSENPSHLSIWHDGWEYNKRPGFKKMIRELWGDEFSGVEKAITEPLNSLIHGDPESSKWNMVVGKNGDPSYAVSKILDRPDLCSKAALEAATWLAEVVGLMTEHFLNAEQKS